MPTTTTIVSISAASDGSVWALDSGGTLLRFAGAPPTWQPATSGTKLTLVSAGSQDNIWCLDGAGTVYRYANEALAPVAGAVALSWVSVGADGTVWGISRDGKTLLYDAGSNSWNPQSTPPLARISVGDAAHVCALGTDGTAYTFAASTWTSVGTPFKDICVTKDGMAWALDPEGQLSASLVTLEKAWHVTGFTLQSVTAGSFSNVRGIDPQGNVIDLTNGVPIDLGESDVQKPSVPVDLDPQGVPIPRKGVPRFDTEDPFDERQSTHLWIVKRGVKMARNQGATGQAFYDLFQPDAIQGPDATNRFQLGLCMGLYEADFNALYANSGPIRTYASHFYDPDTELNWLGQAVPTALTMGRTLFVDALTAYQSNNAILAGYRLGLALHYLTDLGQPHHAANFTNIDEPFLWHGHFETYVLQSQDGVPISEDYTPVPPHLMRTIPDDHFISLARTSKELYVKSEIGPYPVGRYVKELSFYHQRAPLVLAPMLQNAVNAVSNFVVDWMVRATDPGIPIASENILLGVGFDNNLWTKDTLTAPWKVVANSGYVTDVTILPDGRLLGAGDGKLWTKITLNANWLEVPNSQMSDGVKVVAVTMMPDGRILGVGDDFQLWTRDSVTAAAWQQIPNSDKIVDVTIMPDQRVLAAGYDGTLWIRDTLTAPWQQVDNRSGEVQGVTVMQDGVILGVGKDMNLWTRATLNADWVEVSNSGQVIRAIEMPSNYL